MKLVACSVILLLGLAFADRLESEKQPAPSVLPALSDLTGRTFPFSEVIKQTTGQKILVPEKKHQPLMEELAKMAGRVSRSISEPDSPARSKRRINEVSLLFEKALLTEINSHPDFRCTIPTTREGKTQRSGYPDLRVEHLPTKTVAYLDPKLFEASSIDSSFRTFYYEPSPDRSKVTEDALHLLLGFPHDGKMRAWNFGEPRLVDLSTLTVTLKTEFSASNKDLYPGPARDTEEADLE